MMKRAGPVLVVIALLSLLILLSHKLLSPRTEYARQMEIELRDWLLFTEEITRYPTRINVTANLTRLGVSTDIDKIDFGIVPLGVRVRKELSLVNHNPVRVKVRVRVRGPMGEFVHVADEFVMDPGEARTLMLAAQPTQVGSWEGEIEVVVRKPRWEWLMWLL
jgi:hypothetical protein